MKSLVKLLGVILILSGILDVVLANDCKPMRYLLTLITLMMICLVNSFNILGWKNFRISGDCPTVSQLLEI